MPYGYASSACKGKGKTASKQVSTPLASWKDELEFNITTKVTTSTDTQAVKGEPTKQAPIAPSAPEPAPADDRLYPVQREDICKVEGFVEILRAV